MTKAKVREGSWDEISLCDLEGSPLEDDIVSELPERVIAICVDDSTGLYVLTSDGDCYFTAPSIDLDFENDKE